MIGNIQLYDVSEEVVPSELDSISGIVRDLHDTLIDFRRNHGFGRAIAAPQIGVMKRIIYMHIDKPVVFVNPVLRDLGNDMIEVWDSCFCVPNLLVKVMRHQTIVVEYLDENLNSQVMNLSGDLSELLQHEYDHLNGVLMVSRAIDGRSFAYQKQME